MMSFTAALIRFYRTSQPQLHVTGSDDSSLIMVGVLVEDKGHSFVP